jgi:hypothetical protein
VADPDALAYATSGRGASRCAFRGRYATDCHAGLMSNKSTSNGTMTAAKSGGAADEVRPPSKKKLGSADIAELIVAGSAEPGLAHYARALEDENPNASGQAARVLEEVVTRKPELCAPFIDRFVRALSGSHTRAVQASATALPALAKVAPAKVARHLEKLRASFDTTSDVGKESMVRTFVALCLASVAYQKRVVDVLEKALATAEPRTLQRWTELVLPALKGEPHAQARAVVEQRVQTLPRQQAEKISDFLGIKLRPSRIPPG